MEKHDSFRVVLCAAVLALVLALPSGVAAQSAGTGSIVGTVKDPSGAVVPGVKITVRNMGTNVSREASSDEQGGYRVVGLDPGRYELTFETQGFAILKRPEIEVAVGSTTTVNAEMQVTTATEVVTVTEVTPITEPEKVEISSVVSQKQVEELPINGRRWDNFVLLTPGVTPDGTFGLISTRGISGLLNNNTVDGADNNQAFFSEARGRTRTAYTYSQSAIKEFQVGLSTFSAEFGRAAGGTINAVTKSGSNEWHGEVFYYIRDDSLQAREPSLSDPSGNALKNKDRRQQYGLSLGGPIVKDKLFFFGNWDQQLRSETYLVRASGGNAFFSSFITTCQGAMPSAQLITNCAAMEQFFLSQAGLQPRKRRNNVALGKVDYAMTPNHNITGSYNWHRWISPNGIQTQQVVVERGPDDNGLDGVETDVLIVRANSVFGSHSVNELQFQFGRDFEFQTPNGIDPRTRITNGISFGMSEFLPRPAWPLEKRFQWVDNYSRTMGRHLVKVGFDINYVRDLTENIFNGAGVYSYTSLTNLAQDCPTNARTLGCAPILTGGATDLKHWNTYDQAFDIRGQDGRIFIATTDYNFYVQDTFKWTPRLTLHFGVRYEYQTVPKVPAVEVMPGVSVVGFPGQAFSPETEKLNKDTNNWGPRLSFAWDITGDQKNVLRAGGGIYYGRTGNALIRSALLENGVALPSFRLTSSQIAFGPQYPNVLSAPAGSSGTRLVIFTAGGYVNPFISMVDVVYERELFRNAGLSFSYLFARGNHLTHAADINLSPATTTADIVFDADGSSATTTDRTLLATIPFHAGPRPLFDTLPGVPAGTRLGRVIRQTSELNSTYHGFVIQYRQRARFGMFIDAHYTLAKAEDEGQRMGASPFAGRSDTFFDPFDRRAEFGRSDFDSRHRFVSSVIWEPSKVWQIENRVTNALFGDWLLSGVVTANSGQPWDAAISGFLSGSGTNATDTGSVNGAGGDLRLGWLPRNSMFETRTFFVIDTRLQKDVRISETMKIRFLWEAFNLFNRTNVPNRFNYASSVSNPLLRVLSSTTIGGPSSNLTLPRQIVLRMDTSNFTGAADVVNNVYDASKCTFATCIRSASGTLFGARDMQFGLKFIF